MTLKITKGNWQAAYRRISNVIAENGAVIARVNNLRGHNQIKHDADFIAEAGTVANECGLMPRELLAQRDELLDVLSRLALSMRPPQTKATMALLAESTNLIDRVRGGS